MSDTGYFQFELRTQIHCAPGSVLRIPSLFEQLGGKRVLLVSDAGLKQVGVVQRVVDAFDMPSCGTTPQLVGVYTDIAPDAACDTVNAALAYAREVAADAILAVGGGSVLDAAKGVKYALHQHMTDIREAIQAGVKLETRPQAKPMDIPHIAVPTTAGTGAEVTNGAVLYNEQAGIKGLMLVPYLEADIAVLDANLTLGLPAGITAATGFDALTHAVESICSPIKNGFTSALANESARMIEANLATSVNHGSDLGARSAMLQASTMACAAVVNSLNAAPVHNCAHAIGALFHIPHGDANGILLPAVLETLTEFYLPHAASLAFALNLDTRGRTPEQLLEAVIQRIRAMQDECGFDGTLNRFNVSSADMEKIVMAIATDPLAMFYPIPADKIAAIVEKVIK